MYLSTFSYKRCASAHFFSTWLESSHPLLRYISNGWGKIETPHDTVKIGEDRVLDLLVEQVEKLKESISFNQDNLKALAIMDSSEISYDFETK